MVRGAIKTTVNNKGVNTLLKPFIENIIASNIRPFTRILDQERDSISWWSVIKTQKLITGIIICAIDA